ncbi:ABC transporter ATP-binding protein [soil metagenome]
MSVAYGAHAPVLHGIDLRVPVGSVVALLGANGAGKSSTVRAATGLLAHHRGRLAGGRVELFGEDVTGLSASDRVRRGLAQALEGRRIFTQLTVDDNLRAGAITRHWGKRVAADIEHVYERFPELADRRGAKGGVLSGGQQQMLAIGRALVARPKLLILDEPSLGLAPQLVNRIFEVIADIKRDGVTVLLIEQNVAMALGAADFGYVLETGRVVLSGPAAELAADESIRAAYLGGHAA